MNTNLNDLADLICTMEARPDKPFVLRQLKAAATTGFLTPDPDEFGPRGARVYPPSEICKARIYLAAIRAKIDSTTLLAAFKDKRFALAVRDLCEANTTWNLQIMWTSTFGGDLVPYIIWEHIASDGAKDHGVSADPLNPNAFSPAGTIEGIQVFPFTRLCRPLLQKLNEANA